jgi:hypothetical protein
MQRPPGDLHRLIDTDEWEAEKVVRGYERIARCAREFSDVGRFHVSFSGALLEQFCEPRIVDRYQRFVDIPAMLESYRSSSNVEFIGMGYYHPIFPLISTEDWEEQIVRGREIIEDLFGRAPRGFWPSDGAFCMQMIPALVRAGYEYVIVDDANVFAGDGVGDYYQPYIGTFNGASLCVIPRDCELSSAQQSGMDASWFSEQAQGKMAASEHVDRPRLLTTWSNVEEGDWFRETREELSFHGRYLSAFIQGVLSGEIPVQPVLLADFVSQNPPSAEVRVKTSGWNVSPVAGVDAGQNVRSERQLRASQHLQHLSARYWRLTRAQRSLPPPTKAALARVRDLILESESSCYLSSNEEWTAKLYERTAPAAAIIAEAEAAMSPEK